MSDNVGIGPRRNGAAVVIRSHILCQPFLCKDVDVWMAMGVLPLKAFIWATAIRSIVSLSGFRASAEHVGTMSDSSVIYAVILFLLRRSISQWFSRLRTLSRRGESCSSQQVRDEGLDRSKVKWPEAVPRSLNRYSFKVELCDKNSAKEIMVWLLKQAQRFSSRPTKKICRKSNLISP